MFFLLGQDQLNLASCTGNDSFSTFPSLHNGIFLAQFYNLVAHRVSIADQVSGYLTREAARNILVGVAGITLWR